VKAISELKVLILRELETYRSAVDDDLNCKYFITVYLYISSTVLYNVFFNSLFLTMLIYCRYKSTCNLHKTH